MKNTGRSLSQISYISAFLIGVILFWSFGKNWLDLGSMPVFLAGLIGVALVVLAFGAWNIFRNSHHKEN
jgi:predicted exporter